MRDAVTPKFKSRIAFDQVVAFGAAQPAPARRAMGEAPSNFSNDL